jgi:hypothetical protein
LVIKDNWENDVNGPYVSHDGYAGNENCSGNPDRLGHCLRDIAGWQDAHPGTGPILVFLDLKPWWSVAEAWKDDEVFDLDEKLRSILGSRLFTGNDLYQYATGTAYTGSGKTLRQAVSEKGWPLLNALNGKIIVAYTAGRAGFRNETQSNGIDFIAAQSPKRLPFGFFCPDVDNNPNELNPGSTVDEMSTSASQFVVCGNLEAQDHYHVTANRSAKHHQIIHLYGDHVYSADSFVYNYIAVAHGISAIGRDTAPTDTWGGGIPFVGVRRSLPGYFDLRPQSMPTQCMDVNGAFSSNGTKIQLWGCISTSNQKFVYTTEGQLRPQHANTYCTDINGGSAGSGTKVHLWDCDGGSSEKWVITRDGSFKSFNNQAYCLDAARGSTSSGAQFVTYSCSPTWSSQKFYLKPYADWDQTSF